jgi:hypothetical protein
MAAATWTCGATGAGGGGGCSCAGAVLRRGAGLLPALARRRAGACPPTRPPQPLLPPGPGPSPGPSPPRRAIRRERGNTARGRWRESPEEAERLRANIRTVVDLVFKKREEVPLVALYRKEAAEELLAMRRSDMPETSSGRDEFYPSGSMQVGGGGGGQRGALPGLLARAARLRWCSRPSRPPAVQPQPPLTRLWCRHRCRRGTGASGAGTCCGPCTTTRSSSGSCRRARR